jgi:hypothetical protein
MKQANAGRRRRRISDLDTQDKILVQLVSTTLENVDI